MIELTKINDEKILVNALLIEYVESMPESKVVMMNGKFHIVTESYDEIRQKSFDFCRAFSLGNRL